MSHEEKRAKVMERKVCFSCLSPGHVSKSCKVGIKCAVCGRKHPVVMCPEINGKRPKEGTPRKSEQQHETPETTTVKSNLNCTSEVILRTLMINVQNPVT